MSNVWFSADLHFGHAAMAPPPVGHGWRPFASVQEHDETIIHNWNATVREDDHAWILGDVGIGPAHLILDQVTRLNGHKHLVVGNHDQVWPGHRDAYKHHAAWSRFFESIQLFARRRIGRGEDFIMAHCPYAGDHVGQDRYNQWRPRDEGLPLVHGHVHGEWKTSGRQHNVGVDVWDFKPVHLDEVVAEIRDERQALAG